MRVTNKHKAAVAGIEPGCAGDVDETNSGVRVFLEAGLLVDESTIESPPEREPTLEEAKKVVDELASRLADARDQLSDAKLKHGEVVLERDALHARITELEAQLAAKAETAPTAEPTSSPEAPTKKGKG